MIKKIITTLAVLISGILPLSIPLSTQAISSPSSPVNQACSGLKQLTGGTCSKTSDAGVGGIVKNVINIVSLIVGFVSVLVIMFSGFRFITAGGDQNTVSSARNTLMYAVIGLTIATIAQLIVHIVLNSASKITG